MADERIVPIALHQEMQRSYLEYAMSVIVGRALPDVRDGLKPVQRRILFAMYELGLTPDRPYRKCARVVGDVLGKYHPHGDQAVYDALVRLVQTFASRHPLLDGHGNFGSVDDDPAAAMRYTETRLSPLSHRGMLDEIGSDTIDFANNFDGSQQEPTVLPAQLPFLLLNGCSGIAVGMATSIPPHNLGEVVDGLIALLRNPELSDQKLLELIPGPDFPTGGVVLTGSGLRDTYLQGRGSIPMRGVAHIEETQPGKGRHKRGAVVITELPYQLSKAGWIEKLAEQVNEGKITGIADIRDESDREGMRVVVELRRDANAEQVMAELHKRTALQSNFGAIMLALVHGKPQQLSLRQLLEQFLEYRELTMVRRTRYALKRCEDRLEVVEGLIKALNVLREVIEMIQSARDSASAKASLQVQLDLTERQAEAVLAMPLRRLTGLEQESLRKELEELRQEQKELRHLLDDRPALLDTLVKELKQLRKQFATPRRTRLQEGGDDLVAQRAAAQRPNAEAQRLHALAAISSDNRLLLQSDGLLRIASPQSLGKLHLSGPLPFGDHGAHGQLIMAVQPAPTLLAFTSGGRVAALRWEFAAQQPGPIEKFLPESVDGQGEKVVEVLVLPPEDINFSIGLLSSDGRFKRIAAEEFRELSGRATTVLKLKDGVVLERAVICKETDNLIVASSTGRSLRLPIDDNNVPLMGRTAQGPTLMRLLPGETIVGAAVTAADAEVLLISALGQLKKLAVSNLRLCERGDLGEIALKFSNRNDQLVDLRACDVELVAVETQTGSIRLQTDSLLAEDSRGTGLNLELPKTEKVTRLLPLNNQL
ncbi:MAG: DNA topoisomerase 4 subunit A [Synechococcaceae bacterium WBA_2_066]|nr:DNA topoisomerase 4 subunit A [Synechococcaceae bacterium WB6_1B_055]NBQ19071.1 DNA topoisomerase 4 subunit A [Synechococcaceae bacterium WB5_2A_257]NBR43730.1 DNA topoisomerase 4 subunit A [Synechococcaceae bacterium WB5_2B_268]NBY59512.1 DNA topoisomerase 4 subunit A [Synechococcaceae bacterium LLD_019]NCU91210.1 DNA topoisomerase 4 subunit A [Synechococcaceae bacterium WB7_1B_046]NCY14082.1 DNA topoisomerase 4 subunit A [Synechococcaceae bacterium WB8_1A_041]NDA74750.1 DNA topoisomerase